MPNTPAVATTEALPTAGKSTTVGTGNDTG